MNIFLNKFFLKIKALFPRYTLRFVEKHGDDQKDDKYYILAYGEYTPVSLKANEILNNRRIKELLDPDELLDFYANYLEAQDKNNTYFLREILRDGGIILENKFQKLTLTPEEFCNKPWIMQKTHPLDIFRIVSNLYIQCGRDIEKQIACRDKNNDGISLKVLKPKPKD